MQNSDPDPMKHIMNNAALYVKINNILREKKTFFFLLIAL